MGQTQVSCLARWGGCKLSTKTLCALSEAFSIVTLESLTRWCTCRTARSYERLDVFQALCHCLPESLRCQRAGNQQMEYQGRTQTYSRGIACSSTYLLMLPSDHSPLPLVAYGILPWNRLLLPWVGGSGENNNSRHRTRIVCFSSCIEQQQQTSNTNCLLF